MRISSIVFRDMNANKDKMKRILILIDYSSEFSRRLLKGLIQYSNDHGPWIFYRLPTYYKTLYGKEGIVEWAKEWKANASIARWDHEGTSLLTTLNIPIILQNYKFRTPFFSNLTGDYIDTGEIAVLPPNNGKNSWLISYNDF